MTRLTAHRLDNTKTLFAATARSDRELAERLASIRAWAIANGERLNVMMADDTGIVSSIRIG